MTHPNMSYSNDPSYSYDPIVFAHRMRYPSMARLYDICNLFKQAYTLYPYDSTQISQPCSYDYFFYHMGVAPFQT